MNMKNIGHLLERVDNSTKLGKLFNRCMDSVDTMRIISSPVDFSEKENTNVAVMFYDSCLIELYLHSVIDSLNRLRSIANKYINEFGCNWKYYATCNRSDLIQEYGGDENDYDDSGNIVPATDEKLISYSIVSDIQSEHNKRDKSAKER